MVTTLENKMTLLSILAECLQLLQLLPLDVEALFRLSECSRDARDATATHPLWKDAFEELRQQHDRAGVAAAAEQSLEPRARLALGMRLARRDIARLHRFFAWQCDQASAFDMSANAEQDEEFGLFEQGENILNLREGNRPRYNLMNDLIMLNMAEDDMRGADAYGGRAREKEDACYSFGPLLDASDEQVQSDE